MKPGQYPVGSPLDVNSVQTVAHQTLAFKNVLMIVRLRPIPKQERSYIRIEGCLAECCQCIARVSYGFPTAPANPNLIRLGTPALSG